MVKAKLSEVPQTDGYFHKQNGRSIRRPTTEEFTHSKESCVRSCFTKPNCIAYAVCSSLLCKLFEDYSDEFDLRLPLDQAYNWNRIETEKADNCTFGRRLFAYNESYHQSNKEILTELSQKIEKNELEKLVLVNELFEDFDFDAIELQTLETDLSRKLEEEQANNNLFTIVKSGRRFDRSLLSRGEQGRLIAHPKKLPLSQCQSLCINDDRCKSISYCGHPNECMLTTIEGENEIGEVTMAYSQCAVASSKFYGFPNTELRLVAI